MAVTTAVKGKLIAVIGDEVKIWYIILFKSFEKHLNEFNLKDTVIGFLMSGAGELNKTRNPNYFIHDKSKTINFRILIEKGRFSFRDHDRSFAIAIKKGQRPS